MFNWLRPRFVPTAPPGHRVYAIGDIHGCSTLFDTLLDTVRADDAARPPAQTTLILLGDLIDRGPDSRGVVARARAGIEWARLIVLMGNHESIMLDALDGDREQLQGWLRYGGREALASWDVSPALLDDGTLDEIMDAARAAISPEERGWMARMRDTVRIGDYLFVHAGVRPGIALDQQTNDDRLWIRDEFLNSRKRHGAMVVHGHSISNEVEERANRIGLDTGAYATGRLTAMGFEGKQRWLLQTTAAEQAA